MFKRIALDIVVVAVLVGCYFGYKWVGDKFREHNLAVRVAADLVCATPGAAAKYGVVCASPDANQPPAPAQNGTPSAPAAPEKPGDDKKGS